MTLPSEAWEQDIVLDDIELYHFATEGERKLAASLIRSSIDDMVTLKRHLEQGKPLARNVTVNDLQLGREWVARNSGVLSFEECCNICAPSMDWRAVQQAILVDPEGALERVRNQKVALLDDEIAIPQTEAEIAAGEMPITNGRLARGLLEMLQGELEFENASDYDFSSPLPSY